MPAERILVTDDEDPIREIVSSMLTSANFVCSQASSGKEALALLQSGEEYELMLSDLMMPGMDGEALLAATKERFPDMPVVMVTAVHDVSVALGAIRNGAYDYLLKPFEREQLLATVRRALENRRLKLENRAYQTNLEALVTARTEQLRKAVRELEESYDITLEALGDALDLKDRETEGHSKRVTAFTIAIAKKMGLPSEQIRVIARGAFLHDIGKMAIPDAILNKPGKLDPNEIETMREHPYRGYQIVKKISFLSEAAEIVYAHQEKFDGTGYPRGLKGGRRFSPCQNISGKLCAATSTPRFIAFPTWPSQKADIAGSWFVTTNKSCSLAFRCRGSDPSAVYRHIALKHNFEGCSGSHLYFVAVTESGYGCSHSAAYTCSDQCALAAAGYGAYQRTLGCRCTNGLCGLALIAVPLNGAFLVFHFGPVHSRRVLDRSRQDDRISARIDQRSEVNQHLGAALDVTRRLNRADFPLHVSPCWNHDAIVHHYRKCCLRIDRIAFAVSLGRNGVLQGDRNLGPRRNGDFIQARVRCAGRQSRRTWFRSLLRSHQLR